MYIVSYTLAGTKADARVVDYFDMLDFARKLNLPYFEVSTKLHAESVDMLFAILSESFSSRLEWNPSLATTTTDRNNCELM